MKTKPPDTKYEPFLCPVCLHAGYVRRTWIDVESMKLLCAVHGPLLGIQESG